LIAKHTVAEDVVAVDSYVTDINSDAERNLFRSISVALGHFSLHMHRAGYSFDGACKLDQHSVAGRFDDVTTMGGYCWVNNSRSGRLELGQRAFLVQTHETAIPCDRGRRLFPR
jgi:hypothetical protein